MSDIRISNTSGDLQRLNQKLEQALQTARRALTTVATSKQGLISSNVLQQTNSTTSAVGNTNLNLVWTGSTLTISWAAAYVQSLNSLNYSIPVGSKILLASTTYTVFWNPIHQQLVFSTNANLPALSVNPKNINICTFFTGAAGDSGWAGGPGGSPQDFGSLGQHYKNF